MDVLLRTKVRNVHARIKSRQLFFVSSCYTALSSVFKDTLTTVKDICVF
jgi:hypothetical protein